MIIKLFSNKDKKFLRIAILLVVAFVPFLLFQNFATLLANPSASYFNTNRPEKLSGFFVGMYPQEKFSDLDELSTFSNSFVIASGNIP